MRNNWYNIRNWTLIHEGGYVNHPKDPGGATNKGITQRVYAAYRRRQGRPPQSVKNITDYEVEMIYRAQYWNRVRGNDLPNGVDYAVYDYAVNSGVSRAVKELQRVIGVTPDGVIGEITLEAIDQMPDADIIRELCRRRMAFLRRLKIWPTFGKGWSRRVLGDKPGAQREDTGVLDRAIYLADYPAQTPAGPTGSHGCEKGEEKDLGFWARLRAA